MRPAEERHQAEEKANDEEEIRSCVFPAFCRCICGCCHHQPKQETKIPMVDVI